MSYTPYIPSTTSTANITPLITAGYDSFTSVYNSATKKYEENFKLRPTPKAFVITSEVQTLPAAQMTAEGTNSFQAGIMNLGTKRIDVNTWTITLPVTYQSLVHNLYPEMAPKYGVALYQSHLSSQNRNINNLLNTANTSAVTGWDGLSIANTQHPVVGGFYSNSLPDAMDISEASFFTLVKQSANLVNAAGIEMDDALPERFSVGVDKMEDTRVLVESQTRTTGTQTFNINPVDGTLIKGFSVNRYLQPNIYIMRTTVDGCWMYVKQGMKIFQLAGPQNLQLVVTAISMWGAGIDNPRSIQFGYSAA